MTEALVILALVLSGLVLFDLAAYHWGVDSRPTRDDRPDWA